MPGSIAQHSARRVSVETGSGRASSPGGDLWSSGSWWATVWLVSHRSSSISSKFFDAPKVESSRQAANPCHGKPRLGSLPALCSGPAAHPSLSHHIA